MTRRHIEKNRRFWEERSDEYQREHGARLGRTATAWGVWRIPESRVGALGEVAGRDVLELGCGAAQWSVALARRGARVVGVDISGPQLAHARRRARRAKVALPLVGGSAEELPFAGESFDLVFCDHGAIGFTDPKRAIPEAARVLRPGGHLVFCMNTPLHFVCWNPQTERVSDRLVGDYFAMRPGEDEETVEFQLPYGEWIRLFASCDLEIEDLIELRPPPRATTTYEDYVPLDWARRWPAEHIWRVRRRQRTAR